MIDTFDRDSTTYFPNAPQSQEEGARAAALLSRWNLVVARACTFVFQSSAWITSLKALAEGREKNAASYAVMAWRMIGLITSLEQALGTRPEREHSRMPRECLPSDLLLKLATAPYTQKTKMAVASNWAYHLRLASGVLLHCLLPCVLSPGLCICSSSFQLCQLTSKPQRLSCLSHLSTGTKDMRCCPWFLYGYWGTEPKSSDLCDKHLKTESSCQPHSSYETGFFSAAAAWKFMIAILPQPPECTTRPSFIKYFLSTISCPRKGIWTC